MAKSNASFKFSAAGLSADAQAANRDGRVVRNDLSRRQVLRRSVRLVVVVVVGVLVLLRRRVQAEQLNPKTS
ncbi:uncharacterized protein EV422DRAFT_569317 [Fimicolochytrium jonesii]|uniref:uncharacterized protein n=1 Tax=Fimicolochytrium jonesii TaxID=1396493 RepID=UPI0022FE49B4|nr:uncharacterized protein EV422DRAFT_569317 [Fimicolochytrium jonesii]KAI8819042.1 hypothetical protein EV422DRAFT_569317 [Fimicolochytrium jonesii]